MGMILNEHVFDDVLNEYEKVVNSGKWSKLLKDKLKAVKRFQDNWNIDSEKFSEMLDKALAELRWMNAQSGPGRRNEIIKLSQESEESCGKVREAFEELFSHTRNPKNDNARLWFKDSKPDEVETRIENFKSKIEEIKEKNMQDDRAITTYLWLYFPNDYYVYSDYNDQAGIIANALALGYSFNENQNPTIGDFFSLQKQMQNYILRGGGPKNFLKKYREYFCSDSDCYCDPYCTTLANDIGYFVFDQKDKDLYYKWSKANKVKVHGGANILLYGVPGAGKSYEISSKIIKMEKERESKVINDLSEISDRMERVVFHQDYTYSDFIGQIMPQLVDEAKKSSDDNNEAAEVVSNINEKRRLTYVFVPGPFTRILRKAIQDPDHMYYLIIEEINRGNAPAIFGDIFQLLDRKEKKDDESEYGRSEYEITNREIAIEVYRKYPEDQSDDMVNESKKIYLPANLMILATMNTSDQNVFTLDTAFQRRWDMQLIPNNLNSPDIQAWKIPGEDNITWVSFISVVNDKILASSNGIFSSEDKRLGTHFVKADDLKSKEKFSNKVLKYLWDDVFKMSRMGEDKEGSVFKEDMSSLEEVINEYNKDSDNPLKRVFNESVYNEIINENEQINPS